ncbi:MAG: 30S ribosomal protein S16 [Candidatus Uhrbacteria bacterium]|nr:30S ribosomal protein S16 [Candidatus Uhrbacteria bacterium]
MITIRLSRVGTKRAPVYRVVVQPKHNDPWAIATEILGHYNPRKNPPEIVLNADRVKYWLDKGAQASDTVWNLLVDQKIVEGKKRTVSHISGARTKKLEDKATEAKAKADEAAVKAKEATEAAKAAAQAPAPEPEPTPEAPAPEAPAPEAPAAEEQPAE